MFTDGVLSPWKIMASLPPLLYGLLLFMKMENAGLLLTAFIVIALALLWYIANQGYSIWALWPVIVGGFLLLTCIGVLYQGITPTSFVPISRTPAELWAVCLLAILYVGWGVYEARRLASV